MRGRLAGQGALEFLPQLTPVRHAQGVGAEAVIVRELRCADRDRQLRELAVVPARDGERAVGAAQQFVRRDRRMHIPEPSGGGTGAEVGGCLIRQRPLQAAQQRDLQPGSRPVALAAAQRGEDADRRVLACQHVDDGDAGFHRVAVRLTRDVHQPAERLHHEVVAGQARAAGRAEAGDRGVHDRRVDA